MSTAKAKNLYRLFHKKEPSGVVELDVRIPRFVYPIGYGVQITYRSNKWNDAGDWKDYIHWWEHKTYVCIPDPARYGIDPLPGLKVDLGRDRNKITFLGYAIDINLSQNDRSNIPVEGSMFSFGPEQDPGCDERIRHSTMVSFGSEPGKSYDFVAASPDSKVVYIVSVDEDEIWVFVNKSLKITAHGIEG